MVLDIIIYIAVFGAIGLAVYSVFRRTKNTDPNVAGYVYNGKPGVTWLFVLTVLAILFYTFIMPIPLISGQVTYRPEWGGLGLLAYAILLYICYSIIAFVPATAEEIEESKEKGNTVLGSVGSTTASVFAVILSTIGAILASIPGMVSEALNPTLAVKTVGNTVYRVVGNGVEHAIWGVLGLALFVIVVAAIIIFAAMILAIGGTFAIGIIAVIKFFKNLVVNK